MCTQVACYSALLGKTEIQNCEIIDQVAELNEQAEAATKAIKVKRAADRLKR